MHHADTGVMKLEYCITSPFTRTHAALAEEKIQKSQHYAAVEVQNNEQTLWHVNFNGMDYVSSAA